MKTIKNIFGMLLVMIATTVFYSCTEEIPEREPSPLAPEGSQGIYFPSTNPTIVELEPTELTELTFTIAREDSTKAIEVPITVEVNTDDVFVVPATVSFAANEKETTFKVQFPTADEGVGYSLRLSVQGDNFVNPYSAGIPYIGATVTRIKWNALPENSIVWIDGTVLAFYGIGQPPMYVDAETANVGSATRYRFKNVYDVATPGEWNADHSDYIPTPDVDGIYNGYLYNWPGDFDESQDYYTTIEIDKDGNVTMFPCELGMIWSYGMFSIGSIYDYVSTDLAKYPLGKKEGDVITFPANSLYISMADFNDGVKRVADKPTLIYLTKEAYLAANMKIKDFNKLEYGDPIEGAVSEFESVAYNESWNQSFAKAIDIDKDNEESEYKNLYYLADLYAENFGLAFYYNGETVSIPSEQKIGKQVFKKDLYVSQSGSIKSSVTTNSKGVDIYTLGLKFHYEDGTVVGEFAETFYYSKDPVSYAIADFYGNYKLTGPSVFDGVPDADMNVTIAAGETENTFIITGIDYTDKITATFDKENSFLEIAPQDIPDFEYQGQSYPAALLTVDANWDISETAKMSFGFNMKGNLVMVPNSTAIGYIAACDLGYFDGYFDLVFTPQAATRALTQKSAAFHQPISKILNKRVEVKKQKGLKNNFAVQPKTSTKTKLKNTGFTPVF
jgi:hypothetical protein